MKQMEENPMKNEETIEQSIKNDDLEHMQYTDFREISCGKLIPTRGYSDQPYIVKAQDGAWVLCLTSGALHEGQAGQTVCIMRSKDCGQTWEDVYDLEPTSGPEASYAVMYKTDFGRIYCFYNHNTDNIRSVETANSGTFYRVDSLGHFVFKYSDDNGKSFSKNRYEIPQRNFYIDLNNYHHGELKYFWNVGKPFALNGSLYVPLHKIGEFGEPGCFVCTEGVLLRSSNILTERDPNKIEWETLPEGMVGIRAPEGAGKVAEEHSCVILSDGTIYTVFRTVSGHPGKAVSRDGGKTFTKPEFLTFADGRKAKNPRACNFVWKCSNGKFLYWFYNNGTKGYDNRNPVWVCGGMEIDTPQGKSIAWSQPEILLYADDTISSIGYPDLTEEGGYYYISETQKRYARIHKYCSLFFENIWEQFGAGRRIDGACFEGKEGKHSFVKTETFYIRDPSMTGGGWISKRNGVSMIFEYENLMEGTVLADTRLQDGSGFRVWYENGKFFVLAGDGRTQAYAEAEESFFTSERGQFAIVFDAGPNIIYFVYDDKFCDGGENRPFGWQRFSPALQTIGGSDQIKLGTGIKRFRFFNRALTVSEIIKDYRFNNANHR